MQHSSITILLWGLPTWRADSGRGPVTLLSSFFVCDPSDFWRLLSEVGNTRYTQSAQNKQEAVRCSCSMFQIICKVQRFLQNCTTTGAIKMLLRGTELQVPQTAENGCTDESEHLLCSLISQRFVTKGPAVCVASILVLYWRIQSKEETVERKVPPSGSLVSTNRATGLSQSPCKSFTSSRFSGASWLHKHLPHRVCRCWRCVYLQPKYTSLHRTQGWNTTWKLNVHTSEYLSCKSLL